MLDDFDMNIQCDEYLDYLDQLEDYYEYGLAWSDRFEDPRYLDEED